MAAQQEAQPSPSSSSDQGQGAQPQEQGSKNKVGLVFFPFVFFTPETLLGGGLSAVVFRRAYDEDDRRRSDALTTVGLYTMRHQFTFALVGSKYLEEGLFLISPLVAFTRFASDFYGIGNETPTDAKEVYTPWVLRGEGTFSINLIELVYVGLVLAGGYLQIGDFQKEGLVAQRLEKEPSSAGSTGLGIRIERDSRSDNLYPTRGSIVTLKALFYRDSFGGELNYDEIELDARAYLPFVLRSVLALQFYAQSVAGEPPFHYLPQIGGQYLLRGIEQGRYRDRVYTAAQAEWRIPLFWRIGAVAFAGIGNVYPGWEKVRLGDFKATGGLGLRFALKKKERIQFRFDVGFAEDGPKFYLNLLEAF
jgi:hypothetical protein